jgi:hypothetical protein
MATAKNYSAIFPAGKPDNREREPVSLRFATGDQLVPMMPPVKGGNGERWRASSTLLP